MTPRDENEMNQSKRHDAGSTAAIGEPAAAPLPRPEPGAPRPYHFPVFERVTLENGLGVVVAPVRALPMATVMLVSDAGPSAEPGGQEGVANITARALLEGTKRRGTDVTEIFESLGAYALDGLARLKERALRVQAIGTGLWPPKGGAARNQVMAAEIAVPAVFSPIH